MRVTFVLPSFAIKPIGGVRIVYQYADGLVRRGHEVTVVHAGLLEPWQYIGRLRASREPKVLARGLLDAVGARPAGVAWQAVDPRVRMTYVATLAADNVPAGDSVIATSWRTAESVARYPDSKGAKNYLIQHYEVWDGPASRVDATWRAPMRKLVIAEWLYREGLRLGVGEDTLVQLPGPGLDLESFQLSRPVNDRPNRVAMLWSEAPIKGGPDGVAALEEARRSVPDLQAVLFGVKSRPANLPSWIQYVSNPSLERLVGDIYNGSSIYLCPSRSEGWHLPPAEAMACGCALVSTQIDGVSDYALPDCTAVMAPVGARVTLASGIVRLCQDPAERARMALAGRELIGKFGLERSLHRLERGLDCSEAIHRSEAVR